MSADLGVPGITDAVEIARGGTSVVYRARQEAIGRDVAVKVLQNNPDSTTFARFQREVAAMVTLGDHPGILPVYDAGTTAGGTPYLVLPYLPAGSYQDRLAAGGAQGWQEAKRVGVRIAEALGAAHAEGVLHRDLKPGNLLIDRYGNPVLADFGIARLAGGHQTTSGVVTASVAHAAPEVLNGEQPTVASDIYGLASTLYAIATGQAAFVVDTDETLLPLLSRVLTQPPERIPDAPAAFSDLLLSAMAKDPSQRPADAITLGRLLSGMGDESPSPVVSTPPGSPTDTVEVHAALPPPRPGAQAGTGGPADPDPAAPRSTIPGQASPGRRPLLIGLLILAVVLAGIVLARGPRSGEPEVTSAGAPGTEASAEEGRGDLPDPSEDDAEGDGDADALAALPLSEILDGLDLRDLQPIFDPGRLSGVEPRIVRETQVLAPVLENGSTGGEPMQLAGRGSAPAGAGLLAAHILLATEDEALAVLRRLAEREPFEALAAEVSTDSGSADRGGVIGPLVEGAFDDEFEGAALATPPGLVSEPVQTSEGWHLIRTSAADAPGIIDTLRAFTIDVPATGMLRVVTEGDEIDTFLVLLDGDGRFLAADDDLGGGDNGANAMLDHRIDGLQTVTVIVGNLEDFGGQVVVRSQVIPWEPLDVGAAQGSLDPDNQLVGYSLEITGDQQLVSMRSDDFDSWLRITDGAGRVRADARGGSDEAVDLTQLEPGTYNVIASHDDDHLAEGTFEIALE